MYEKVIKREKKGEKIHTRTIGAKVQGKEEGSKHTARTCRSCSRRCRTAGRGRSDGRSPCHPGLAVSPEDSRPVSSQGFWDDSTVVYIVSVAYSKLQTLVSSHAGRDSRLGIQLLRDIRIARVQRRVQVLHISCPLLRCDPSADCSRGICRSDLQRCFATSKLCIKLPSTPCGAGGLGPESVDPACEVSACGATVIDGRVVAGTTRGDVRALALGDDVEVPAGGGAVDRGAGEWDAGMPGGGGNCPCQVSA